MGMDPVLTFGLPRTFRGPSADLPRSFRERRVPGYASRITYKNGPKAQEDMLPKTFEWLRSRLQGCG